MISGNAPVRMTGARQGDRAQSWRASITRFGSGAPRWPLERQRLHVSTATPRAAAGTERLARHAENSMGEAGREAPVPIRESVAIATRLRAG